MKVIKLFIISFVVLFLLLTAFSSLLPSSVRISRAIDISATAGEVSTQLREIGRWDQWNEYIKALPEKKISGDTLTAAQLTVAIMSADSLRVQTKWRQSNGKTFPGVFNLIHSNSITTVQWYFDFTFKWYPWEKFSSIVYDKLLGSQMEKSLINLKGLVEKAP